MAFWPCGLGLMALFTVKAAQKQPWSQLAVPSVAFSSCSSNDNGFVSGVASGLQRCPLWESSWVWQHCVFPCVPPARAGGDFLQSLTLGYPTFRLLLPFLPTGTSQSMHSHSNDFAKSVPLGWTPFPSLKPIAIVPLSVKSPLILRKDQLLIFFFCFKALCITHSCGIAHHFR